jgi:hypothetical protein
LRARLGINWAATIVVVIGVLGLMSQQSLAAFPCMGGPGEFQVGVDTVNQVPLCQQRADSFEQPADSAPRPFTNQDRTIFGRVADIVKILNAIAGKSAAEKAETKESKEYKRLQAGYWDFAKAPKGTPKGDGCAATYFSLDGAVTISGPSGEYRQASITFWGGKIPATKTPRKMSMTLAQTGDRPATVQAYHFAMGEGKVNGVTFAVPNATALVNGMLDEHMFSVAVKNKRWLKVTWRDGLNARKQLVKCLGT